MTARRDGAPPSDYGPITYSLIPVFQLNEPRLSVLPFSRERAGVIRARRPVAKSQHAGAVIFVDISPDSETRKPPLDLREV